MPAPARFDADDAMIVLSDLQPQIVARGTRTNPENDLRKAVSILVGAAGVLGLPIFSSVVPWGAGSVAETIDELKGLPPIARSTVGVFEDEDSRRAIAEHGRSVMAIGGVSSEVAVLHATLGALRAGYAVHVLTDACGGFTGRTEDAAFQQMEAAGATMSSVPSFLTSVMPSITDPRAQAVFAGLSRFWS